MKKGKKAETAPTEVRAGYVKRYLVNHELSETFTNWHTALGAKGALGTKYKGKDVRVRLRLKRDHWRLIVKEPKEVRIHERAQEAAQANTEAVASTAN